MIRAAYVALIGLIGAGLVHISAVLMMAGMAQPDHMTRFAALAAPNTLTMLPAVSAAAAPLPLLDPAFAHAVCRFSLAQEPLRIRLAPPDTLWTMGFYDPIGANVYQVNDRVTEGRPADILVMTPAQFARIRDNPPDDLDQLTVVEWPAGTEGALLVRIFAPEPAARREAAEAIAKGRCGPLSTAS